MEIGFALLSRYAETNSDGTVDILGGGYDTVTAPNFPAIFPLAVTVGLINAQSAEQTSGEQLYCCLDIRNDLDKSIMGKPIDGFLDPIALPNGLRASKRQLTTKIVMNVGPVVFPQPGRYEVLITFGKKPDSIVKSLFIQAELPNASDA
jgi:hypothetical protein